MNIEKSSSRTKDRIEEAEDVLHAMRQCRSRLNRLNLSHPAAYADMAVQLLKQAIGAEKQGGPTSPRDEEWRRPATRSSAASRRGIAPPRDEE